MVARIVVVLLLLDAAIDENPHRNSDRKKLNSQVGVSDFDFEKSRNS